MTAIKASIVLLAALTATRLMRRGSAASRHWLLFVAIVCAGLTPMLERLAPGWDLGLAPHVSDLTVSPGGRDALGVLWLAGAAFAVASLILGFARCRRRGARGRRLTDPRALALLDDLCRELAIVRDVHLIECDEPTMPLTWGAMEPKILLPAAARTWSDDRLRLVLAHELAHVARCDWMLQIVAETIACVYWFNPLFWISRAALRFESDRACDDVVLTQGASAADYAAELIGIARAFRASRDVSAASAVARAGSLERRIAAALNVHLNRSRLSPLACAATTAIVLACAMPVAGFAMRAADESPPSTLSDMQRQIMMRLGSEERRLHFVTRDVSLMSSRIEGRVELHALLGVDGVLNGVRFVEPVHPDLASAARAIVRQWRPEPALVRGVPVEVPIRMTVDFRR